MYRARDLNSVSAKVVSRFSAAAIWASGVVAENMAWSAAISFCDFGFGWAYTAEMAIAPQINKLTNGFIDKFLMVSITASIPSRLPLAPFWKSPGRSRPLRNLYGPARDHS